MVFYQAKALQELGRSREADKLFRTMIDYGKNPANRKQAVDYFAVSLPDMLLFSEDPDKRRQLHCDFLAALGYRGLSEFREAEKYFLKVLKADPNHVKAAVLFRNMQFEIKQFSGGAR